MVVFRNFLFIVEKLVFILILRFGLLFGRILLSFILVVSISFNVGVSYFIGLFLLNILLESVFKLINSNFFNFVFFFLFVIVLLFVKLIGILGIFGFMFFGK